KEEFISELEAKRRRELALLEHIEMEFKAASEMLKSSQEQLEKLREEWKGTLKDRINLERERAASQATVHLCGRLLQEISLLENSPTIPLSLLKAESLKELMENSEHRLSKLEMEVERVEAKTRILEENMEKVGGQILDSKINLALLNYRSATAKENLERVERELREAKTQLDSLIKKAESTGPRIATTRSTGEILEEMRVTDGHLAALAGVSDDVERMYESYSRLYLELKEKAQLAVENREKALEEVKTRMQAWRAVIQSLLDRVNLAYQRILTQLQATGEVRLVDANDIEAAGLEILVGFKGGSPVPLNAYTQSGGERTTATMSFLLALQQHVRSPIRAVDEYDVHMDPKNRELIAQTLISAIRDTDAQYVVITPSQITFAKDGVNVITVQNVEGKSIVREVA
ncbi:MAG: hypothetical protein QXQ41_04380, partial [Candidatus Bathyarchaeia archaeon]